MKTHITFVLDSSGSMAAIEDDTRGGFNAFLEDQRNEDGEASVSLYDFNTTVERMYVGYPIVEAPKLTEANYTPGGSTALYDAIYTAVTETSDRIAEIGDQPDNVIVVVLTDGEENASETPQTRVREQVEYRRKEQGWEFMFIGANQDAALTADEMGVDRNQSLNMAHSGEGAQAAYESTSEQVRNVRRGGHTDGYDDADRQRQEDASER